MFSNALFPSLRALALLCLLLALVSSANCNNEEQQKSLAKKEFLDGNLPAHEEGRTFGRIKRLQFALLPIMYKLGVMSTMLMVLTAISLKGLLIGATLLMLNVSALLAKIHVWASSKSHGWGAEEPPSGGHKDVHVHIHNGHHEHSVSPWTSYGGGGHYDRMDQDATDQYDDAFYYDYLRRRNNAMYWRGRPLIAATDSPGLIGSIMNSIGGYSNK